LECQWRVQMLWVLPDDGARPGLGVEEIPLYSVQYKVGGPELLDVVVLAIHPMHSGYQQGHIIVRMCPQLPRNVQLLSPLEVWAEQERCNATQDMQLLKEPLHNTVLGNIVQLEEQQQDQEQVPWREPSLVLQVLFGYRRGWEQASNLVRIAAWLSKEGHKQGLYAAPEVVVALPMIHGAQDMSPVADQHVGYDGHAVLPDLDLGLPLSLEEGVVAHLQHFVGKCQDAVDKARP
ncbi:hypothetical protein FRC09_020944, partial [Ceratobasidium sp. 395]